MLDLRIRGRKALVCAASKGLGRACATALGRAGVVEGYRHACRRHGGGHVEPVQDQDQRRCPNDGRTPANRVPR